MKKMMGLAGLLAVCLTGYGAETGSSAPAPSAGRVSPVVQRPKDTPAQVAIFEAFVNPYLLRLNGAFYASAGRELPEFDQKVVHAILVERELALAEAKRPAYPTPADQRAALDAVRKAAENRLRQAQGEKVLAAFERYEGALRHYQSVNQINQILIFRNEPLNAQQFGHMVALLRANEPAELKLDASKEQMEAYISARQQAHVRMLAEASAYLSPVQLDQFRLEFEIEARYLRYYDMRNRQAQELGKPVEAGAR